jgi:hypothetical protein
VRLLPLFAVFLCACGPHDSTDGFDRDVSNACHKAVEYHLPHPDSARYSYESQTGGDRTAWRQTGTVDSADDYGRVYRGTYVCGVAGQDGSYTGLATVTIDT